MRTIPIVQIDAFTQTRFRGNPAAVCPLTAWLPDATLQAIALENNLSETAFYVPGDAPGRYHLRWFTPVHEVELCGHATLSAAAVLFAEADHDRLVFDTRSGPLTVARDGEAYVMDFPARTVSPADAPPGLAAAIGTPPGAVFRARDMVVCLPTAEAVRGIVPDFPAIEALGVYALCVTAPGTGEDSDVDFVSRFFAPAQGVLEDPVTGSAHCTLAPFWAERLGKRTLKARQVSARGGELTCTVVGDRVHLRGHAVRVLEGRLLLG